MFEFQSIQWLFIIRHQNGALACIGVGKWEGQEGHSHFTSCMIIFVSVRSNFAASWSRFHISTMQAPPGGNSLNHFNGHCLRFCRRDCLRSKSSFPKYWKWVWANLIREKCQQTLIEAMSFDIEIVHVFVCFWRNLLDIQIYFLVFRKLFYSTSAKDN